MSFTFKPTRISLNVQQVSRDIMPWLRIAMDEAEIRLIDEMKKEIDLVSGSPHEWRDRLKAHVKHIREECTPDMISYFVGPGYPEDPENANWMRAMVIAFGNAPPIYAGPEGTEVWDDDLWNRTTSRVKHRHQIPRSWYHEGRNYIANSINNMRVQFRDLVEAAMRMMPSSVFSRNVVVRR